MGPVTKTKFNLDWLNADLNPEWANTLEEVKNNPFQAKCKSCCKFIELSNMGRQAIVSHFKSKQHEKGILVLKNQSGILQEFVNKKKECLPDKKSGAGGAQLSLSESSNQDVNNNTNDKTNAASSKEIMKSFLRTENVIDAEILWCLNIVMNHKSLNSCKNEISLLQRMFPDSEVCRKMTLSPSKAAYCILFGLAFYFNEKLLTDITSCKKFVVCFDEALNKVIQKGQMDLFIRFWSQQNNMVEIRYLTSVFLNHASAEDILQKFVDGLQELHCNNVLQISMDGPNVNWKFLRLFKEQKDAPELIEIGSCGLHIIHGSLQAGHKNAGWKINEFLRGIYYLFHDSPARRGDFINITKSKLFPLKFCQVRWVENVTVATRALEVVDSIKLYVTDKNVKLPSNISISNVKSGISDKFIKPKLAFFATVAGILEPFLKLFQTSRPMIPFLYYHLEKILRDILDRFVKKEITLLPLRKLIKIDFSKSENLLRFDTIDIGFSTRKYLREFKGPEADKIQFYKDCQLFLIGVTKKILERCNLKYDFIKYVSCLSPQVMTDFEVAKDRCKHMLQVLYDKKFISSTVAENADSQYKELIADTSFLEQCKTFQENSDRLDVFFRQKLENKKPDLLEVIKLVLILSHGNATVESGFSINKQILVENLHEESLIGQRKVYDSILSLGGISEFTINNGVRYHFKNAHSRYKENVEKKKKEANIEEKAEKDRKRAMAQINILETKKKKIHDSATYDALAIDREIMELRKKI